MKAAETTASRTLSKRSEQTWRDRLSELAGDKREAALALYDAGVENGHSELHSAWVVAELAGWTAVDHGCFGAWSEA